MVSLASEGGGRATLLQGGQRLPRSTTRRGPQALRCYGVSLVLVLFCIRLEASFGQRCVGIATQRNSLERFSQAVSLASANEGSYQEQQCKSAGRYDGPNGASMLFQPSNAMECLMWSSPYLNQGPWRQGPWLTNKSN